jgi:ABC-2 type transport system permease protein
VSAANLNAAIVLTRRELVRFSRQPSRIIASLLTPALLWIFFAAGFADSFAPPSYAPHDGISYSLFMLPGIATLIVVFTAIFAAMSLIEDRREGFLQALMVSPTPRWVLVVSKACGASIIATAQGLLVLLAAPLLGDGYSLGALALAALALALTACAVTSMGLAAAWWVNSSEGFHAVMNTILMPMWLLSGALFPAQDAAGWLSILMSLNPLRWTTDALRDALTPGIADHGALPWVGTIVFALAMVFLAWRTLGTSRR